MQRRGRLCRCGWCIDRLVVQMIVRMRLTVIARHESGTVEETSEGGAMLLLVFLGGLVIFSSSRLLSIVQGIRLLALAGLDCLDRGPEAIIDIVDAGTRAKEGAKAHHAGRGWVPLPEVDRVCEESGSQVPDWLGNDIEEGLPYRIMVRWSGGKEEMEEWMSKCSQTKPKYKSWVWSVQSADSIQTCHINPGDIGPPLFVARLPRDYLAYLFDLCTGTHYTRGRALILIKNTRRVSHERSGSLLLLDCVYELAQWSSGEASE